MSVSWNNINLEKLYSNANAVADKKSIVISKCYLQSEWFLTINYFSEFNSKLLVMLQSLIFILVMMPPPPTLATSLGPSALPSLPMMTCPVGVSLEATYFFQALGEDESFVKSR